MRFLPLIGNAIAIAIDWHGITAPGRLIATTAPEVERMLLEDAVDGVLLTPV